MVILGIDVVSVDEFQTLVMLVCGRVAQAEENALEKVIPAAAKTWVLQVGEASQTPGGGTPTTDGDGVQEGARFAARFQGKP